MSNNKLKSFTLSEMLVVMIITAIIVGMAFSVLRLVQKQVSIIEQNLDKSLQFSLFEQKLWQDFNEYNIIEYHSKDNRIIMSSEIDSIYYIFQDNITIRNKDTLRLKLIIDKMLFDGKVVDDGKIDAVSISGAIEIPDYYIFVYRKNDVATYMNYDGF